MFRRKPNRHKIIKRKLTYIRFMQLLPEGLRLWPAAVGLWWNRWIDTILLNLIWVVSFFLFPLLPPVTFGVFYALRDPNELDNRLKLLWTGFKKYLGVSYLNTLITLALLALCYLNWVFYMSMETFLLQLLSSISIVAAVAWGGIQFYLIPVFFQQEDEKLFLAYRNAASLFFSSSFYGTLTLAFVILICALSVVAPPLAFFGSPIMLIFYSYYVVSDRMIHFKAIQPESTPYVYDPYLAEEDILAVYTEYENK